MFKTYQSAAIFTGCIAGFIFTIAVDPERRSFSSPHLMDAYFFIAPFALLATSAIAERSWVSLLAAVVLVIPVSFLFIFCNMFFVFNGRESLPLVIWGAPYHTIATPFPGAHWRIQALLSFACILAIWGLGQMVVRWGLRWDLIEGKVRIFKWALLPGLALYVVSWQAKMSGTFQEPLFTPTGYYVSLGAYFAIFPVSTWWLHFLADKYAKRRADAPSAVEVSQSTT